MLVDSLCRDDTEKRDCKRKAGLLDIQLPMHVGEHKYNEGKLRAYVMLHSWRPLFLPIPLA